MPIVLTVFKNLPTFDKWVPINGNPKFGYKLNSDNNDTTDNLYVNKNIDERTQTSRPTYRCANVPAANTRLCFNRHGEPYHVIESSNMNENFFKSPNYTSSTCQWITDLTAPRVNNVSVYRNGRSTSNAKTPSSEDIQTCPREIIHVDKLLLDGVIGYYEYALYVHQELELNNAPSTRRNPTRTKNNVARSVTSNFIFNLRRYSDKMDIIRNATITTVKISQINSTHINNVNDARCEEYGYEQRFAVGYGFLSATLCNKYSDDWYVNVIANVKLFGASILDVKTQLNRDHNEECVEKYIFLIGSGEGCIGVRDKCVYFNGCIHTIGGNECGDGNIVCW